MCGRTVGAAPTSRCSYSTHAGEDAPLSHGRMLILTAIGTNRPGLFNDLLDICTQEVGANLEATRTVVLAGKACMILTFSFSSAHSRSKEEEVNRTLEAFTDAKIITEWISRDEVHDFKELNMARRVMRVVMHTPDASNLVLNLTSCLGALNIDVTSLTSDVEDLEFSRLQMFMLDAIIVLPAKLSMADLVHSLNKFKQEMNVQKLELKQYDSNSITD
ncbi:hypothetical protein CYMTET_8724 [Cymbomonas tetramitiformis]|uniref:ACT domain-containing protein n=1 Tax=Cymbomonas tetramitiformis TaxID=36881 RepID=A0AAE0GSZ0_9CHLO|nr:hypothetical protein CYMTET_8724 [Cymbomonas tetramitiformis]